MISICIPTLHTAANMRALKVCLACIADTTESDYELLVDVHNTDRDLYTSFNFLAERAGGDYLIWLCDDTFVAPGWDRAFLEVATPETLVIGGMVESGIYPVVNHCISHNFGETPEQFNRVAFEAFARDAELPLFESWSCPWLIPRKMFDGFDVGMVGFKRAGLELEFYHRWKGKKARAKAWCYHLQKWTVRNGGMINGMGFTPESPGDDH